jgi:hypothetical protein
LIKFLGCFGLAIEELYEFKSPFSFGNRTYHDSGYVVFEWVGPEDSPINEPSGGRGYSRTSIDAFLLGKVNGRTTQILLEWKFTEGLSREIALGRFCGGQGIERLRRYSVVLARLRRQGDLPFEFEDEYRASHPKSLLGIYDLSPDHLYQLLRMTLLAKTTVGKPLGVRTIEDHRIVHLTYSQNNRINILHPEYVVLSPGLKQFTGRPLHYVWREVLSPGEKERFIHGHWDKAITVLGDDKLRAYLSERYV